MHCEDGVWDSVRSNSILQPFATVFLSIRLKGESDKQADLDDADHAVSKRLGLFTLEWDGASCLLLVTQRWLE